MCTLPKNIVSMFEGIEEKRLTELDQSLEDNMEYADLTSLESNLYKEIYKSLPEDMKEIFSQYETCIENIKIIYQSFYYKNGFIDGTSLKNMFSMNSTIPEMNHISLDAALKLHT